MFEFFLLLVVIGTVVLTVKLGALLLHLLLLPLKIVGGLLVALFALPVLIFVLPVVVIGAVLIGLALPVILVGGIAGLFGLLGLCHLM